MKCWRRCDLENNEMKTLVSAFLFVLTGLSAAQTPSLVFNHVTVIDATGSLPQPDMTVVITGNRITALDKTGETMIPRNAQVVDATGKFLIPGLWDMHTHVQDGFPGAGEEKSLSQFFKLYLANGVTGIRDMGGRHLTWFVQRRQEVAEGRRLGPRIVTAGQALDGPHATDSIKLPLSDTTMARQVVREQKQRGADFVKIYEQLPREVYFVVADECKKQGIPFAGHVPVGVSAAEASEAGQSSIEHLGVGRIREACYVFETATPGTSPIDPDPQLTAKLREVLASFWNGQHNPELLTPALNTWLESETGQSILKTMAAEQGELQAFTLRKQTIEDGGRVIHCKAVFEKKTRFYKFPMAADGKLDWIGDEPDIYSETRAAALFARFKTNGTWQCPTLTALRAFHRADPTVMNDPRLKYVSPWLQMLMHPKNDARYKDWTALELEWAKQIYQLDAALIRKMKDAGVEFLAGTDSILDFCFPGFSLHDELALLVEAGLTPMEALQAATCNPAKFLNMTDSLGTVEKGKIADLVLLEANPLDDIHNTQKIASVVRNGKLFSQAALQKMLAEVEATASEK
jgi:imidazolonepropionase-like amidohydrolase